MGLACVGSRVGFLPPFEVLVYVHEMCVYVLVLINLDGRVRTRVISL